MGLTKMNKIEHVVYSGWLVKSPPERKATWRIFRARWKKRFFVLFKPAGSLPGQYELNYYSDEGCGRKKGSIDLELCEQIIESLDSDQFPYLLAIKTVCRGKDRTYFLAADSEDEMTAWVRNLCSVCELKQEDSPTGIPGQKDEKMPTPASTVVANVSPNGHVQTVTTCQPVSINHQPARSPPPPTKLSTSPSYIPLVECRSGSKKQRETPPLERHESVDSVPEEMAPPPPNKTGQFGQLGKIQDSHDSVFSEVYDIPPPSKNASLNMDDLYQVPPNRSQGDDLNQALAYDVPPRRGSPSTPRSSGSDRTESLASVGGFVTPQDFPLSTYDVPPPRPHSGSNQENPPVRPPKPSVLQSPYQNLPTTSKIFPSDLSMTVPSPPKPSERPIQTDSYDIPRSNSIGSKNQSLDLVAPPPKKCTPNNNVHAYINAAKGIMNKVPLDNMYLAMNKSETESERDSVYTDMSVVSGSGRLRTDVDSSYTDMSVAAAQDLYQSPPPCKMHQRGHTVAGARAPQNPEETYLNQIWSSTRTKSFKRHEQGNYTNQGSSTHAGKPPPLPPVTVTKPAILQLPSKHNSVSSSDDDDESVNGVHIPKSMRAVPPPPNSEDKELKYLDLALDEYTQEPPSRTVPSAQAQSTPTEYREIDFVKTHALSNTRKWKDGQRRGEL